MACSSPVRRCSKFLTAAPAAAAERVLLTAVPVPPSGPLPALMRSVRA